MRSPLQSPLPATPLLEYHQPCLNYQSMTFVLLHKINTQEVGEHFHSLCVAAHEFKGESPSWARYSQGVQCQMAISLAWADSVASSATVQEGMQLAQAKACCHCTVEC